MYGIYIDISQHKWVLWNNTGHLKRKGRMSHLDTPHFINCRSKPKHQLNRLIYDKSTKSWRSRSKGTNLRGIENVEVLAIPFEAPIWTNEKDKQYKYLEKILSGWSRRSQDYLINEVSEKDCFDHVCTVLHRLGHNHPHLIKQSLQGVNVMWMRVTYHMIYNLCGMLKEDLKVKLFGMGNGSSL